MNEKIDAKITVECTIRDCIDRNTLEKFFNNNIEEWISVLLFEENLWAFIEDDYVILKVEEL